MNFLKYLLPYFLLSCWVFAEQKPRILHFQRDSQNEGEFFGVIRETSQKMEKILNKDFLEIGTTVEKFPFVGIQATYLVYSKNMPLVLTMIKRVPDSDKGEYFHISKVKIIDGKHYQVSETPDYAYLRIFRDEKLWTELENAASDKK